jgi:hypothetical protein
VEEKPFLSKVNASEGSNKAAKQIEAVARMQLEETFLD